MSDLLSKKKDRRYQYHEYPYSRCTRTFTIPTRTAERIVTMADTRNVSMSDLTSFLLTMGLDAMDRGDLTLPKVETLSRIDYEP